MGVLAVLLGGCDLGPPAPPPQPNILLVIADDLGTQLGAYGDRQAITPNLDRLARRGVVFERAYCQFPLCNPSRTSLLSGLRPQVTGVLDNFTEPRRLRSDLRFLPEELSAQGYLTFKAGKILHATYEGAITWEQVGALDGSLRRLPRRTQEGGPARVGAKKHGLVAQMPPRAGVDESLDQFFWQEVSDDLASRLTDAVAADQTIRMLRESHELRQQTGQRRPFFGALGLSSPHLPYVTPTRFLRRFAADRFPLPPAPFDDLADLPGLARERVFKHPDVALEDQQQIRAAYYSAVSFMDEQLGRVLAELERLDLADETVVVVTSDHGTHLGEHSGLWEKMTFFDEVTRVPLLVAAPGKSRGKRHAGIVELIDLFPTLTALAGLPARPDLPGRDLGLALTSPSREIRGAALTVIGFGGPERLAKSVRSRRYRYSEWLNRRESELYDLTVDPHEFNNLVTSPRWLPIKKRLHRLMKRLESGQPLGKEAEEDEAPASAGT